MTHRDRIRRLKERREALGASLDAVGSELLVHKSTVSCWERGKRDCHEIFLKAWEELIVRWEKHGPPKEPETSSPSQPPTTQPPTTPPDDERRKPTGEAALEAGSQDRACASPLQEQK